MMASADGSSRYQRLQHDASRPVPTTIGTSITQMTLNATGQPGTYLEATRRKADGTFVRGVINLTPEQLAKKRANDREAQRAVRERTRNQIETLKCRVEALESQQPFQELQEVLRQREQVQAENDELKRRMQTILSLLHPIAGPQYMNGNNSSLRLGWPGYS